MNEREKGDVLCEMRPQLARIFRLRLVRLYL